MVLLPLHICTGMKEFQAAYNKMNTRYSVLGSSSWFFTPWPSRHYKQLLLPLLWLTPSGHPLFVNFINKRCAVYRLVCEPESSGWILFPYQQLQRTSVFSTVDSNSIVDRLFNSTVPLSTTLNSVLTPYLFFVRLVRFIRQGLARQECTRCGAYLHRIQRYW
jgi:hypothetical protein